MTPSERTTLMWKARIDVSLHSLRAKASVLAVPTDT